VDGKRTSIYLSRSDLDQLEALGNPSLMVLIRLGMDAMIRKSTPMADIGSAKRQKAPKLPARVGPVCAHPMARRDRKSGLCGACGTNVGTGSLV
jgi:hypothetical protein